MGPDIKTERQDLDTLKNLGSKSEWKYDGRDPKFLETFKNRFPQNNYTVTFRNEHEFSSCCPKTGQPDYADHLEIFYKPKEKCIESKSLKLYLGTYRNHKDFGEDICNEILDDLVKCCEPVWMRVAIKMTSRGGLSWEPIAWYNKDKYLKENK